MEFKPFSISNLLSPLEFMQVDKPPMVSIQGIVACSLEGTIGDKGTIPWFIKDDMAHFVNVTTSGEGTNTLVMGRKTVESLGNKLEHINKGRRKVVMVGQGNHIKGLSGQASNLDAGLIAWHDNVNPKPAQIFICGGARLYNEAISRKLMEKVHVTWVHRKDFKPILGDTKIEVPWLLENYYLSEFPLDWKSSPDNQYWYQFTTWKPKANLF